MQRKRSLGTRFLVLCVNLLYPGVSLPFVQVNFLGRKAQNHFFPLTGS